MQEDMDRDDKVYFKQTCQIVVSALLGNLSTIRNFKPKKKSDAHHWLSPVWVIATHERKKKRTIFNQENEGQTAMDLAFFFWMCVCVC